MTDQHSTIAQQQTEAVLQALTELKGDLEHPRSADFVTGVRRAVTQVENLWRLACIGATRDPQGQLRTAEHKRDAAARLMDELPNLLHTMEEDARYQEGDHPEEVPHPAVGDGIIYGVSVIRRALHLNHQP